MAALTYQEILSELKNKQYHPVYFLQGEEPYMIDQISNYIEKNVLSEGERSFNQTILYGKETDFMTILDNAKRYPMMSDKQVVIVKEAQQLKTLEKLESYIKQPLASTILVLCYKYKKLDARKTFAKTVKSHTVFFTSDKLYENKIPDWISGYLKRQSHLIDPKAAVLLTEYLGNDLSKIANELDKLILNVEEGRMIEVGDIERNIGISKDYNVFELQTAIGQKNLEKANRIVNYIKANPKSNPLVVVLATLYSFFSKLYMMHYLQGRSDNDLRTALKVHPYFMNEYKRAAGKYSLAKTEAVIGLLHEYDLRSKGVNNHSVSEGELLKELVYKIMH